jgi:hypothetical protein
MKTPEHILLALDFQAFTQQELYSSQHAHNMPNDYEKLSPRSDNGTL